MTHFSETLWYTPMEHHNQHYQQHFQQQQQQQQQQQKAMSFYTSNENPSGLLSLSSSSYTPNDEDSPTNNRSDITSSSSSADKEHMFEKPLTPSDVGKLNRLVIPKQHAEKYFPLAAAAAAAAEVADKGASSTGGVLLGFEDETGKCWRFRYSYWNSSQSYVLTKGWSRYVKEKKLDAGDVVLFERHRCEPDRFFIGWRRRGSAPPVQSPVHHFLSPLTSSQRHQVHQRQGYTPPQGISSPNGFSYQHDHQSFHAAGTTDIRHQVTQKTAKKSSTGGSSRKLRLFGVNLECQLEEDLEEEPQTSDGSSLSSQGQGHGGSGFGSNAGHMSYNYYDYMGYPPNHHNHMDVNFPQDVNQMRNRLG